MAADADDLLVKAGKNTSRGFVTGDQLDDADLVNSFDGDETVAFSSGE